MRALILALALAGCTTTTTPVHGPPPLAAVAAATSPRLETLKAVELAYAGAAEAFIAKGSPDAALHKEARAYDALEYLRTQEKAPEVEFTAALFYANFAIADLLGGLNEEMPGVAIPHAHH